MPDKPTHCRLFVILAREASKAAIFRRGPHIWTEIILWDTQTDTFTEGQWFKGRLYEKRCDLSPDGSKMIYFAAKHSKPFKSLQDSNTWTAISRPPYLTALALWFNVGTWGGGGYFGDDTFVCVHQPIKPTVYDNGRPGGFRAYRTLLEESLDDFLLKRRGWQKVQGNFQTYQSFEHVYLYDNPFIWQKDSPDHAYNIAMREVGSNWKRYGGHEILDFTLTREQDKAEFILESTEWADWDQQGRLVYTHQGKLFAGQIRTNGIEPVQLADFNPNKVRLIESPPWAKTWDQVE